MFASNHHRHRANDAFRRPDKTRSPSFYYYLKHLSIPVVLLERYSRYRLAQLGADLLFFITYLLST